jgi:hypothetical protein
MCHAVPRAEDRVGLFEQGRLRNARWRLMCAHDAVQLLIQVALGPVSGAFLPPDPSRQRPAGAAIVWRRKAKLSA